MDISTHLIWGMFFGIIGYGFFSYGKKQKATIPLLTGILLFIFPYFIANVNMLIAAGIFLVFLPYFANKLSH